MFTLSLHDRSVPKRHHTWAQAAFWTDIRAPFEPFTVGHGRVDRELRVDGRFVERTFIDVIG